MPGALQDSYHLFMKAIGWIAVAIGFVLLGVSLVMQLGYSPFAHPGMTPGPDRVDVLRLDGIRWFMIAIAGAVCTVRRTPRRRERLGPESAAWIAVPLGALVGVIVMAVIATAAWFMWMARLPGGMPMENVMLCGAHFAIPAALLLTFAVSLVD